MGARSLFIVLLSYILFTGLLLCEVGAEARKSPGVPSSEEDYFRVRNSLKSLSIVRVYIAEAPGLGHQGATLTMMKRLRELGFKGTFEVIYEDAAGKKLATLLPEFDAGGPPLQKVPSLKMTFRAQSDFAKDSGAPTVFFGISGADDAARPADYIRVEYFLKLQPYRWREKSVLLAAGGRSWPLGGSDLPFIYALPEPLDPASFIRRQFSYLPDEGRVSGLLSLNEALERVELLCAYGLTKFGGPSKLEKLIRGIRRAIHLKPQAFRGGVVVLLFSELSDEKAGILLKAVEGPGGVSVATIDDPELPGFLKEILPGDILILRGGAVPQNIFEYFFSRGTLPPTIAGVNARNLSFLTGKPFISTVIPDFPLEDPLIQKRLGAVTDAIMSGGSDLQIEVISRFILDSKDPFSDLSKHFLNIAYSLKTEGGDRILHGVARAFEIINSFPRVSGNRWPVGRSPCRELMKNLTGNPAKRISAVK